MAWEPHINSSFQVGIVVLCAILAPIAPVLVGLRLWSKSILRSRLKWGDYLIILSCITLLGVWLPIILLFAGGGGANWELKDRGIGFWIMRVECLVIASTFYLLSSYLCRVSILCIYYELLRQTPWMSHIIMAVGAWVIICGVVSLGVQLGVGIQDVLFVMADQGPDAVEEGPKWVVYGVLPDVLSCVCDIAVFALPLKSLWGLQMRNRKRKIRLLFTFTVGFIACVLSLLRILAWKLPGFIGQAPTDTYIRRDAFEVLYPIEITFGILGACLPMLRPICHRKEYPSGNNSYAMGPVRNAGSRTALTQDSAYGNANISIHSKRPSVGQDEEAVW
ncbi:hypothetical protein FJTKL_14203 [Diaporthe vaccinii]|uniref:Rhodopsin domain-containing protein n=1 Tax=Diaporthe vaccinii TaxID=105482 RepID=A0ABR4E8K0_9PEZI